VQFASCPCTCSPLARSTPRSCLLQLCAARHPAALLGVVAQQVRGLCAPSVWLQCAHRCTVSLHATHDQQQVQQHQRHAASPTCVRVRVSAVWWQCGQVTTTGRGDASTRVCAAKKASEAACRPLCSTTTCTCVGCEAGCEAAAGVTLTAQPIGTYCSSTGTPCATASACFGMFTAGRNARAVRTSDAENRAFYE